MPTTVLSEIPVFDGLNRKYIDELSTWIRRHDFNDGDTVIKEGERSRGLYILSRGKVRVVKSCGEKETAVAELTGPSVFGEMAFLTGEVHSATIVAAGPVVTGVLPRELFMGKLHDDNAAALRLVYNIAQILSYRLRKATQQICELSASARLVEGPPEKGTRCALRDFRDEMMQECPE